MKTVLELHVTVTEDPDAPIKCISHSDGDFEEVKQAWIRLRDHLTERINSENECPFSPKFIGTKHGPLNQGVSLKAEPWRPPCGVLPDKEDNAA